MIKLFGFRITPFFLFILGLELLGLLLSIYLGLLLYRHTPEIMSNDSFNQSVGTGLFIFAALLMLTPGFFLQIKIINKVKKPIKDISTGIGVSLIIMTIIVISNYSSLDSKTIFLAALLSACIGISVSKLSVVGKYWRFLIRSGVN